VHHFTPQTKQAELQWKNAIPLTAKKSKVCQSVGKVYTSILSNTERDHFVLFNTSFRYNQQRQCVLYSNVCILCI